MTTETKRHAQALPTGCRISKAERKKLNAAIARTIHNIDAENRAGLHARQRLNIVRSTPGMTSKSRAMAIMSNKTNGQLAGNRLWVRGSRFVVDVRKRIDEINARALATMEASR
jgi:hypothetical protein